MKFSQILFLCLSSVLFFGCNEYTSQICKENLRADVRGLEGEHTLVVQDSEFRVTKIATSFKRVEKGVYKAEGNHQLYVCDIAGKRFMEDHNMNTNTYALHLLRMNEKGFSASFTAFDKTELDAKKVPYKIIVREPEQLFAKFFGNPTESTQVLIVDNQAIDSAVMADLLKPIAISMTMY